MHDVRKMLTVKDVLAIVPIARSTLYRMEAEGRFPRGHLVGKNKVWFADQIAAWQETLPHGTAGQHTAGQHRSRLKAV